MRRTALGPLVASIAPWAQYLAFLLAGSFYYLLLAAFFTVAAGYSIWPVLLLALSVLLAGFSSGTSLVAPRTSAACGGIVSALFLIFALRLWTSPGAAPAWYVVPASLALIAAGVVVRTGPAAPWRAASRPARIAMSVVIALPALLATWILSRIAWFLLPWFR